MASVAIECKCGTAILGATGYTALELLKILARHPHVEVTALTLCGQRCRQWKRLLCQTEAGVYEQWYGHVFTRSLPDESDYFVAATPGVLECACCGKSNVNTSGSLPVFSISTPPFASAA